MGMAGQRLAPIIAHYRRPFLPLLGRLIGLDIQWHDLTGQPYFIEIVCPYLGSVGASQAPLFASQKGGPMTASSMARFLKALYAEAGISGASSHSGLRTLTRRLAERGVDLKAIAEIAGHTSIRTTAMYVEANPQRLARILHDVTW